MATHAVTRCHDDKNGDVPFEPSSAVRSSGQQGTSGLQGMKGIASRTKPQKPERIMPR